MKRNYFFILAFALVANMAVGQVLSDVTPTNWKFSKMQKGNAKSLFLVENSKIAGNLSYPFRAADGKGGAFVMNNWVAQVNVEYSAMTDEQKKSFEDFYAACNIIDGGTYGNLFCYQGANSTATYAGAVKNTSTALGAPSLNVFSSDDLALDANYRVTLIIRIICEAGAKGDMGVYVGTSHWDGVDPGNYRNFNISYAEPFNGYWVKYEYDIHLKSNTDPKYKTLPFNSKIGLGGAANNALILIRDMKLEKIQEIDPDRNPVKKTAEPATGIFSPSYNNNLITFAKEGEIHVIDATANIEVYATDGKLVATKLPNSSTHTVIPIQGKGVFIVKSGKSVNKVVL